jgi:formamidopyrimidine-DNA glycosylase
MPELPEVETVRRGLEPILTGRRLDRVAILDSRLTRPEPPEAIATRLEGDRVVAVGRRGKYVVIELASGNHLLVHLRMTGSFGAGENGALEDDPHRRAVVTLDDGSDVVYRDVRRFGTWTLLEQDEVGDYLDARIGPEPFARRFSATGLAESLSGRRAPIKAVLLAQKAVAGVGNVYADEALWRARIHPARPAGALGVGEVRALHRAVRSVLRTGISRQGATLRDYRDPAGRVGRMQDELAVYGREGEPCPRCGTPIQKGRVGSRGTWYCPRCQEEATRR